MPFHIDDPRLVEAEIGGRRWQFWLCQRGRRIARHKHGHGTDDVELDGDKMSVPDAEGAAAAPDAFDEVFETLWLAALPFEPEMALADFEDRFTFADYPALAEAFGEVLERQLGRSIKKLAEEARKAQADGAAEGTAEGGGKKKSTPKAPKETMSPTAT